MRRSIMKRGKEAGVSDSPKRQSGELVDSLRQIAAVPPGEQSLWDSTVAAWAADTIKELEQRCKELEALEINHASLQKLLVRKDEKIAALEGALKAASAREEPCIHCSWHLGALWEISPDCPTHGPGRQSEGV